MTYNMIMKVVNEKLEELTEESYNTLQYKAAEIMVNRMSTNNLTREYFKENPMQFQTCYIQAMFKRI